MGLDVYVGSLTRYYTGDWETVVQRMAREEGLTVEVVRPENAEDAITDPEEIRPLVDAWRQRVSTGLGSNIESPLDWDESDKSPYFTDKPAWDCYSSLLLWAAYDEHPDLARPDQGVEDWSSDAAFRRSSDPAFKTRYSQLLRDVECWLPHDFPFTFRAAEPTEQERSFGSSFALCRELEDLNQRTWGASDDLLSQWRMEGADHGAPLEVGARFAFSIMLQLAREAVAHRLVMKLDY